MKRAWGVSAFLGIALLIGAVLYARWSNPPAAPNDIVDNPVVAPPQDTPKPESEAEKTRRMFLGVWRDEYQGKRTMTLNEDGSATMLVELQGVQAFLFADKLRFDMKWSLEGKTLTKKTVGGEPKDKVALILNTMGNTAEDTLVEITDERLLLLDKNGKTQYDWKRADESADKK